MNQNSHTVTSVEGKPAATTFNNVSAGLFGKTKLFLTSSRVVETTRRIISRRYSELLLSEIDSAEITTGGNPLWILLGILTLGFYGAGIIFFIVYFLSKQQFLIIRSKGNAQILAMEGDEEHYRQFMFYILKAAEEVKHPTRDRHDVPAMNRY